MRILNTISSLLPVNRPAQTMLVAILTLVSIASSTSAQTVEFTQNSKATTTMNLSVPLTNYPGRGISLPVNLSYSSNVWRIGYNKPIYSSSGVRRSAAEAIYAEHSTAGWTTSLDVPKVEWPRANDFYNFQGKPYSFANIHSYRVPRVYIHMPDGTTHELRKSDTPYQSSGFIDMSGTFYAVDSSRLRYDSTNETNGTLYLPDGTRYVISSSTTQYIDRNGNTLTYNASTRQWSDTMGRTINMPWPANPSATDYTYSLPGYNGGTLTYTMKFRSLSQVLSPGSPALKPAGDYYLPNPALPPTDYNSNNFPQPTGTDAMFISDYADFEQTTSYTYVIGRGQSGTSVFNPVVLAEIVLPNGQRYQFFYNNYGEIDKVIYPTSGYQRYQYNTVPSLSSVQVPYHQGSRGMTSRWVSANGSGTDEQQWIYQVTSIGGYQVSVTEPFGLKTVTYLTPIGSGSNSFGYTSAIGGLPFEERVYAPVAQGGAMLRRNLTEYAQTSATLTRPSPGTGTYVAYRNPRPVKTVSLILDTGGNALSSASTSTYDTTYQFSVGVDRSSSSEYAYTTVDQTTAQSAAITSQPLGSLVRKNETTYLTTNANYRNRNILGLPTANVIKNAAGTIVAQTTLSYDEAIYPLITYGAITGWTDPLTSYRGNVTTTSRWLDYPTATWIQTHAQFDQCGNVKSSWDELNRQSQIDYSPTYVFAYPTATTSAVPDSSGAYGQSSGLTTSTVYDLNTGKVTSSTDANGRTTTFQYNDSLNRITRVDRPDGGWTITAYSDVPGNTYVHTQTLQQTTPVQQSVEAYQFFDRLGRPSRTFSKEGTTYITSDVEYDGMGRTWRTSNPYRTSSLTDPVNPSNRWTTIGFDALSRATSVTAPDGSQAITAYTASVSGNLGMKVTRTDPRGKTRQSIADAQGRLVQVVEDPAGVAFVTTYTYDVLNNLRKIAQGSQLRYFGYDSFARVIRVKNVEQTVNAALSWTDPITSYNGWTMGFAYDAVGNVVSRTDARGVVTNYTYDGLNRLTTVRYTNDPQSTPGMDRYYDGYRGGSNFSIPNSRGQLWQVETPGQVLFTTDNFDVMGRSLNHKQQFWVSGSWGSAYQVQRSYNYAGQIVTQTYPSGRTVAYEYDLAARTKKVSGTLGDGTSRNYADNFQYSEWGTVEQEKFGTQTPLYHKKHYNIRGQVYDIRLSTVSWQTDQWNWNRGALINWYDSSSNYPYWNPNSGTDNNGDVLRSEFHIPDNDQISTSSFTRTMYTYDSLNRVNSVTEAQDGITQTFVQAYTYDAYGNRTINQALTTANVPKPNYTADGATNRLVAPAGFSYGYDNAGNQTNDNYTGGGQRTFDAENRMNAAQQTSVWHNYKYSGDGYRVRRIVNAVETWGIYGIDGELVAEYAQSGATGSPLKEFGYRNGDLLITAESAGQIRWLVPDHLGTPRMIADQTGSLANIRRHDYLPFGEEIGLIGGRSAAKGYLPDTTRQKFTGYERDAETGLDYARARYYAGAQGRFSSVDPLMGSAQLINPQTFNRYTYCLNSPTNLTDPKGLMAGAEQGWQGAQNGFWGSSYPFNQPHFGGPEVYAVAARLHDLQVAVTDFFNRLPPEATYIGGLTWGWTDWGNLNEDGAPMSESVSFNPNKGLDPYFYEAGTPTSFGERASGFYLPATFIGVQVATTYVNTRGEAFPFPFPDTGEAFTGGGAGGEWEDESTIYRVATPGQSAFQLRSGEQGLSVFNPNAVVPPLTPAEVLASFRPGSVVVTRTGTQISSLGLVLTRTPGASTLPPRLQAAHMEIRPGPGMTRNVFKKALKGLE